MGKRRILVIGSQCEAMPRLSFLPKVAEDLHVVMTDPDLGGCEPALPEDSLILDPEASKAKRSIKEAFGRASRDDATLIIAFVGHGEFAGSDFYLLPLNGEVPPDSETGIHLVQFIKELHRNNSNVDGLVVLLDACYAGIAAADAAAKWVTELTGTLRFEVLAAVADRPAADGCFSRNLTDLLRNGIDAIEGSPVGELVRCEHARKILIDSCKNQVPQLPSYNADEALYLGKNAIYLHTRPPWYGTSTASEIERLTAWFQPTPQLEKAVEKMEQARCVALLGGPGTGKSTLVAALSRPEITVGMVPADFVHGILFISERTTPESFADELDMQLEQSLSDFSAAAESFRRSVPPEEFASLNAIERQIGGPLRRVETTGRVRLIIDGLDRLTGETCHMMQKALDALTDDPELPFLRLLLTARPGTPLPPSAVSLTIETVTPKDLHTYLTRREIAPAACDAIVSRAEGNWLMAQLLADLAVSDSAFGTAALPADLVALYAHALGAAGANNADRWRMILRPVLGVLAAAGVGPVLPLNLLIVASESLGGPSRPTPVHDALFDLRVFVARSALGTEKEQVGLFHQTLADYLFGPSAGPFSIDAQEPHAALVRAIETLAPMKQHDSSDPLHRYAQAREAAHLWEVGQYERAMSSLDLRSSVIPAENLSRWQTWYRRAQTELGADRHVTLTIRRCIADWTWKAGDYRAALELCEELLPDAERVLGSDHSETLTTRGNIAHFTGELGDRRTALRLCQELLPDVERVLGADDHETLRTRNNVAYWTMETGDAETALQLFEELLPDTKRVLGADDEATLTIRSNIASLTEHTGDAETALQLYKELVSDDERALGIDHPKTFMHRSNLAASTANTGDAETALQLYKELLLDMERVLGADHPSTYIVRHHIAYWTGETGDAETALQLYKELLPDVQQVLGADHPHTLRVRGELPYLIGKTGDAQTALQLYKELLPDMERVLGADHPDILTTRSNCALWTGLAGDPLTALVLYEELLPDMERTFGPAHPYTDTVRRSIDTLRG